MKTKTCHNWFIWGTNSKGTIGINLVSQLQVLFEEYKLIYKIYCYMKDEGTNLFTMTKFFKQTISCEDLGILEPFESVYFGHALFKTW